MSQPSPIIRFEGISKSFGGAHALRNVSFSIPRGDIHALVGENGAGKSTLIRICGGVFTADEGKIWFDGQEVRFQHPMESRDAGISIVHQEIPMCPHLTAAENVFLGREMPHLAGMINWREVNRQAQAVFDQLGVDVRPHDLIGRLPIAKQQMVSIAQALFLKSKLLIMDEPTSALGKQETDHLFSIIRDLKAQGLTIVYVSHKLEEVFEIADCISTLRDGEYIETVPKAGSTPDQVVHMMVGREIDNLFPKEYGAAQDEVLLGVRHLNVPGRFEDVSFDLHRGEVLGLVGLQGSGTSEVMRALFGQYKNVTGKISLHGEHIAVKSSLDAIRHGIAYIPADRQAEGLFSTMSVRDNTGILSLRRIAAALGWISGRTLSRFARRAVEEFGIRTASIHSSITSLSGGNQQKVVVAKSLSTEPLIIMMDDPTRGVDVGAKSEIHQLLNRFTAQGCGVLLVSSELPEVLAMSDRVIVMYRGQVRAQLTQDEADSDAVMRLATGVGESGEGGDAAGADAPESSVYALAAKTVI